jgi:hypothetical protein
MVCRIVRRFKLIRLIHLNPIPMAMGERMDSKSLAEAIHGMWIVMTMAFETGMRSRWKQIRVTRIVMVTV